MSRVMLRGSMAVAIVLCTLIVSAFAQTTGLITGEIKDSSGAVVPGVTVTARNNATNATRSVTSNESGIYSFLSLPPGTYTITAELSGFNTVTEAVTLEVQQAARVNMTLSVGGLTEAAEVSAVTPLMTTENATVGTVIENRRIVELPLNGRNYLQLVALSPNVSAEFGSAGQSGSRQGGTRSEQQLSISGQRREFNYYTLDGVDNTDVNFNTYIFMPSIDALQEFKVQTGIYSAEFGRGASQVNVVTKSGSNDFHGTLFEFVRNDRFDSKPYNFTASPIAKPPFKWNQYGGTVGGPLVFRNRLFFMSNFEGYRDRKQLQQLFSVPSAAMRKGDFSEVSAPLRDPLGGFFAGNIIPQTRLNPTSLKLLEFYPEPNVPNRPQLTDNYLALQNRVIDKDQFTTRVDFVEGASSTWAMRYSWGDETQVNPALMLNGTKLTTNVHQVMVSNTKTLGTNMVNELRFGYNRFFNELGTELAGVRDVVKELAIPGLSTPLDAAWGIPQIPIQGFATFGNSTEGPYTNRNQAFEIVDNVSWLKGRHSVRFGLSLRKDHFNQVGNEFARGRFGFQNQATGHAFADYMLGYIRTSEAAVALANAQFRALSQAYYFDDTWKMRSDMTLNFGLRYEYTPPWLDTNGTLVNADVPFKDQTPNVADMSRHPTLVRIGEGEVYEGVPIRFDPRIKIVRDGRLGSRLVNDDKLNFAPRFGWAWTPNERWTVRAGTGVFYVQDQGNPRFDMARNMGGRLSVPADNFNLTFQSPFAAVTNPCGVVPPLVCISNPYVLANDVDRKTPYMVQYLFNVQRELGRSTAIEIGYLGSRSNRLERMYNYNEAIPGAPSTGSIPSRRPWPEFDKIQTIGNVSRAEYNSLSMKVTRRFDDGFSVLAGYTLSKSMDSGSGIRTLGTDPLFPQNSYCLEECEWGPSVFDSRHRFVSSVLYELPFGEGKSHLTDGVGRALLGGWQISTIVTASSGFPINILSGTDRSNTGAGYDRPNLTGQDPNLPRGDRTIQKWFNTDAFVLQPLGTFGNSGRNTVTGPGIFNVDLSIIRNFKTTRSTSLQFRAEAFNVLNNPNWGDPERALTNARFGQINSTRKPMREVQFGAKFIF